MLMIRIMFYKKINYSLIMQCFIYLSQRSTQLNIGSIVCNLNYLWLCMKICEVLTRHNVGNVTWTLSYSFYVI